jgi:protein disulfide-isomerase-like protein
MKLSNVNVIDVNKINKINKFNNMVKNSITLVAFVAPWCGHCKALHPKWRTLKKMMKRFMSEKKLVIATVEEKYINEVDIKSEVSGFPTIKLYKDGEHVDDYNGPRELPGLYNYIKSHVKLINKNKQNKKKGKTKNKKLKKNKKSKTKKTKRKSKNRKKNKTKKRSKSPFNRLNTIYKLMKKSRKK